MFQRVATVICHLSSVICRLSSVFAPLHLSRILYKSATFYAKQTQFPKSPNECKLIYNKGLQKKRRFRSPKKQTQFKPNFFKGPNERKRLCHKGL